MSDHQSAWRTGEDVQVLDNVLDDSGVAPATRRALLGQASAALLSAGAGGVLLAACGGGKSSSSQSHAATSSSAPAAGSSTSSSATPALANTPMDIMNVAITAEALAVTYLSAVIKMAPGTPVAKFTDVLKAANASEFDHYKALKSLGAKPLTTKFWAPKGFFGTNLSGVFPTLQLAEALFINAYLIGTTAFAKAGKSDLARYTVEIGAVEAQHLALANFAAGKLPPNDLGFTGYPMTNIGQIVSALEGAGVGFGKQGSKPGMFVHFAPPPPGTTLPITQSMPR